MFVRYDSIFLRIGSLVFFYILDEAEGPQVLKTDVAEFFGKILACTKAGQKGPKWPDLCVCPLRQHFPQDWLISFFIYFARSWGTISTQNWQSWIFLENSCLPKSRPKRPKMAQFVFVRYGSIFLRIGSLVFLCILHEVEGPQVLKTDVAEFFGKIFACAKTKLRQPGFLRKFSLPWKWANLWLNLNINEKKLFSVKRELSTILSRWNFL